MDDKELIKVLRRPVAKWQARYHTARNERGALIAERDNLREMLGRFADVRNRSARREWCPFDGDPERPAAMAIRKGRR